MMMTGIEQARSVALRQHIIKRAGLNSGHQEGTVVLKSEDRPGVTLGRAGGGGGGVQARRSPGQAGGLQVGGVGLGLRLHLAAPTPS